MIRTLAFLLLALACCARLHRTNPGWADDALGEPSARTLWQASLPVPATAEIQPVVGATFHLIKGFEPEVDGYRFLHGVALAFHIGRLYASFGHNQGGENTVTEEARWTVSDDEGATWSPVKTMAAGKAGVAVSHGVFLETKGQLWAFMGAFEQDYANTHTVAFRLDDETGDWQSLATVAEEGFWPCSEPVRLPEGNWLMAGASLGGANPPAVAISHGDDLLHWDVVRIPFAEGVEQVWGESTVIADEGNLTLISRWGGEAFALVSTSADGGRNWTPLAPSNLPMAGSKPCAGLLSTGQRYLLATTAADAGHRRSPLTIALSHPGEEQFSRIFWIRDAVHEGTVESHPQARLAYPYAIEHEGKLYVGYSNDGGRGAESDGTRPFWNNNSAELAIISIEALSLD